MALLFWKAEHTMWFPSNHKGADQVARLERLVTRHDVVINGKTVVWRKRGDGRPLVLIHGGHGSWLHWARNIEFLAQHHQVWVADLPGYGDSDSLDGTDFDQLVNTTRQSLDALIGRDVAIRLMGFSFGGLVAATLASRRPAVDQLILLGPAGHGGTRRPRGELQAWKHLSPDSLAWRAVMRHNLLTHMLHEAHHIDELAIEVQGQSSLRTRFYSKQISRSGGLTQALDAYQGPVLLAWGEHDVTADPKAAGSQLTERSAQRKAVVIAESGHWVQYEQADRLNELAYEWMKSTETTP